MLTKLNVQKAALFWACVLCLFVSYGHVVNSTEPKDEPFVAFEDGFCQGEASKEFASHDEMAAYEKEHDVRFKSYQYVSEPDDCIEITHAIGRRGGSFLPTPVSPPPKTRPIPPIDVEPIVANPTDLTQQFLDEYNECWQRIAKGKIEDYVDTKYRFEVEATSGTEADPYLLGQTVAGSQLIEIYDLNSTYVAGQLKTDYGVQVNRWHVIMQTAMHEWIHAEQGAVTYDKIYLLVKNEVEAQKGGYERYKKIYGREPPYKYYTADEVNKIKGPNWDKNVARFTALMNKLKVNGALSKTEEAEVDKLALFFQGVVNQLVGKFNEGSYSGKNFDLCS